MKSRSGNKVHLSAELCGLKILYNLLILLHWGQINQAGQLLENNNSQISLVAFLRFPKSGGHNWRDVLSPEWNPNQRPPSPPRCRGNVELLDRSSPPENSKYHFDSFNDQGLFCIVPSNGASPPWSRSWTCPEAHYSCAWPNVARCRWPSRTTPTSARSLPEGKYCFRILTLKLYLLDDFYPTSGHLVCRPPVLDAPSRKALYGLLSVLQVDQNLHELLLLKLVVLPGTHPQALSYCTSPTFGIWKARLVVLSFHTISSNTNVSNCTVRATRALPSMAQTIC